MSGASVTVRGADRLERTLDGAAADLADLTAVNSEVARQLAVNAAGAAPKVSGRLAGSVTGTGTPAAAVVSASAAYAGVINYGWPARNISPNPFLTGTVEDSTELWVARYEAECGRIISNVKGA